MVVPRALGCTRRSGYHPQVYCDLRRPGPFAPRARCTLRMGSCMQQSLRRWIGIAITLSLPAMVFAPAVCAQSDQRSLVTAATLTFANFRNDPDMAWLKRNLGRAKAVLIAPEITKAGFILGGSGGRAVVVARDTKSGKGVGPAFYTLATASVGFQAGIAVSEMVTLVMTDKGLNTLLADSFKTGGDAAVAAGPVGAGAQTDLVADFV